MAFLRVSDRHKHLLLAFDSSACGGPALCRTLGLTPLLLPAPLYVLDLQLVSIGINVLPYLQSGADGREQGAGAGQGYNEQSQPGHPLASAGCTFKSTMRPKILAAARGVLCLERACRAVLMEEGRAPGPAKETMNTADLDNGGLLQLQQDTMSRQDNELEELERSVNSTKVGVQGASKLGYLFHDLSLAGQDGWQGH